MKNNLYFLWIVSLIYMLGTSSTASCINYLQFDPGISNSAIACTPPSITYSLTPVTCIGGGDGRIVITPSGGTSPYIYQWSNGETTLDIDSLSAGTYTVTVTDDLGCSIEEVIFLADGNLPLQNYYKDQDQDGFGNPTVIQTSCTGAPVGFINNSFDCNDSLSSVNPNMAEFCNGIDDDCDELTDEFISGPVIYNGAQPSYSVEARIRNGNTGFEAVLFTPVDPAPSGVQLNPTGAPVWNSNGNTYGDIHSFLFEYRASTGTSILKVDFNRDGDYNDPSETAQSLSPTLSGKGFRFVNLFAQGSNAGPTAVQINNFTLNGTNLGNFSSFGDSSVLVLFEDVSGLFFNVTATGNFSFSAGSSQERPRIWIRLGSAQDTAICPTTWYRDQDMDGFGNFNDSILSFSEPSGFVINALDCNDNMISVNPLATEICNGLDDDCDGLLDINDPSNIDTLPPLIVCAADTVFPANAPGCTGAIMLNNPVITEACSVSSLINNAPASYPLGTTTVIWTVTDANNNSAVCTQIVTVIDTLQALITSDAFNFCPGTTTTLNANPGMSTYSWSTGDFNQSLIVGVEGSYSVTITNAVGCIDTSASVNVSLRTRASDLNQDGVTETQDYLILIAAFNLTCSGCPEDINNDGTVNIEDFLLFVSEFNLFCN